MELPGVSKLLIDLEEKRTEIDKRENEYNGLKVKENDQRYSAQMAADKFKSLSEVNKSILKFLKDIKDIFKLYLK